MSFYIPPLFRIEERRALVGFIEAHAFGTLVSSGPAGLSVSHVPFVVEAPADGPVTLLAHFARSNPHWRELEGATDVLAIFQGPHAYVSPTWYENHPAVPTWNYTVVHARGRARRVDEAALRGMLARLTATYEKGNAQPWRMEALPEEFTAKMVDGIAGFAIEVETLEGKFKLSQNRPGRDAALVADALETRGEGDLAAMMRAQARAPRR